MGDGASSYLIANGYNPSTAGGNYSLNSATIGAWIQQAGSIANGTSVAIGALARILVNGAATAYSTRVNDGTALISSPASLLTTHWAGRRLSSAGKDLWRAGTQYNAVDAIASSSIASTFIVGSATSAAGFGNDRIACAYTAAGLSDAEMVAMHAALQFYMQGVGIAAAGTEINPIPYHLGGFILGTAVLDDPAHVDVHDFLAAPPQVDYVPPPADDA
jgi:hypothetical protein